jgi:hypothetical protein
MAATVTIRVDQRTHDLLVQLARERHTNVAAVAREALDHYRRDRFFAQVRADLIQLMANPAEWDDYQAEFASMDDTLKDGSDDLPWER